VKLSISHKIGLLFFGVLISILLITFFINNYLLQTTINDYIRSSLQSKTDLISIIVERNVRTREGLVRKNLVIAEQYLGTDLHTSQGATRTYYASHPVTEEPIPLELRSFMSGTRELSDSTDVVDQIQQLTESVVTIYQYAEGSGLVSVATTLRDTDGNRRVGHYIPIDAPVYRLLSENSTLVQREYYDGQWYFAAYKPLYNESGVIGAVYVAVNQVDLDELRDDILSIKIGDTGFPYIIGNVGQVIVHPSAEGDYIYYKPHIKEIIFQKTGTIEYTEEADNRPRTRIAFYKYLPEMDWILIAETYVDEYYDRLLVLRRLEIIVLAVTAGLTYLISFLMGKLVSSPINTMNEKLRDIAQGEAGFDKKLQIARSDEIGQLASNFNSFVSKLRRLTDLEKKEIEFSLREAQVVALQNQINPHFLYNTLDSIRCMIELDDERSVEMVQLLSDLFRVSIGRGESLVTLREELEHVELYLSIEKIRFPELFRIRYNVHEACLELYVVKFLLQPIIENSIKHGFAEREKDGLIEVTAAIVDSELLEIRIEDNGSGFTYQPPAHNSHDDPEAMPGIALANIRERINLHFGPGYGLEIETREGQGTRVTLRLPVLTHPVDHGPEPAHAESDARGAAAGRNVIESP
jgi:sensor histidine kinase YesM